MYNIEKIGYRPTWAEINLKNLAHNFKLIKQSLPKVKIMVCVKADGYGHGIRQVSKKLVSCGVDYLGVASIDEGIILRQERIRKPILVLGAVLKEYLEPIFRYSLTPTVCSEEIALALHAKAKARGKPIAIHIKVDTGMGRIGVLCEEALTFTAKIASLPFLSIEGIFTHLACADVNNDFTLQQIGMFSTLLSNLEDRAIHIPLVHAANSMGVISYPNSHFTMARPGLILYGLYPKEGLPLVLKPVLSLKTRVIYTKRVGAGYGISYGHTYKTSRSTTIVTLPIGYGDGYPRNLSNTGPVLIKSRRFTISGRVCMDQIMVDVGNTKVKVGDEVVLIGSQAKKKITAEELATLSSTIPYEIVCGLGNRIPRVYTD
jgi:alanine racemase